MDETNVEGPNPSGLCLCGCGQRTWVATYTSARQGFVRGKPVRYVRGHVILPKPQTSVVNLETGCHIWQGATYHGHPVLRVRRSGMKRADRHYYEAKHGPLAPGTRPVHTCGIDLCVNPDHMAVRSQIEAVQDAGRAKLTEATARAILEAGLSVPIRELAERNGVTEAAIRAVLNGTTWKSVAPELARPLVQTEGRFRRGETPNSRRNVREVS